MTSGSRLPRSEILRGYRAFAAVFAQRKYVDAERLRCFYIFEQAIPPGSVSVGFAVRNARNAVMRNRMRRMMREAYRMQKSDIMSVCRSSGVLLRCVLLADSKKIDPKTDHRTLQDSVRKILCDLRRHILPAEDL